MWFQPLSALAFGLLVLVATVRATGTVAVAFVDVKFDDKAAIWSLLMDRRYSKVIAITTGITDHGEAAQELKQYLIRQNEMPNVYGRTFQQSKLKMFQGGFGLPEPPSHQWWWEGNQELGGREFPEANVRSLQRELRGNAVRVFQLAPTTPELVNTVINAADYGSIRSFMLLHGYNSRQMTNAQQTEFLQNLRRWVKARNPDSEVFFTTSFDSYASLKGGKQPLRDLETMFPAYDIDQAMKDPFWSRQLIRGQQLSGKPMPFDYGGDPKVLDDWIYQARRYPEQNAYFRGAIADYIRNDILVDRHAGENNLVMNRLHNTHLPEFEQPTTLELADANHVAAFHRALDHGQASGMHFEPTHYPSAPRRPGDAIKLEPVEQRGGDMHALLLKNADVTHDLAWIQNLAHNAHV